MFIEALAGIGGVSALGLGLHLSPYPMKLRQIQAVRTQCIRNRWVALTFDDGPGRVLTPALLDMLEASGAKGSFFLLGRKAVESPEIVESIVARGHEIGCHSMNHRNAWKSAPGKARRDVAEGFEALGRWRNGRMLFRPPHGKLTFSTWREVLRRDSGLAWWTIDSGDTFSELPPTSLAAESLAREGGGVVLLHDFDREDSRRNEFVLTATEKVLETARREGLSIRKLGDILEHRA